MTGRGQQPDDLRTGVEMQAAALAGCTGVAGRRSCRSLDGAAPASVFAAVEAEALQPLPTKAFALASWSKALVGPDIHAKVGKTIYSVPWRLIEQRLDARETATMVQFFHNGHLVATHGASRRASRPTSATTRQRRSRSGCGPRPGAAPAPRRSARPAPR